MLCLFENVSLGATCIYCPPDLLEQQFPLLHLEFELVTQFSVVRLEAVTLLHQPRPSLGTGESLYLFIISVTN